ncbi:MAG: radical SAM protein [Nitrospirae bacterium RBG_13_43_8]|nr:MAG: radical SAM protein [Nitrospirae bacterium RBG_13_43_8]
MQKNRKTKRRVLTKRGVIWLGQTCNLRCYFCYFMDRIATQTHPEHPFMSLEKAKKICKTLVNYYHNNSIDIQGGEPTIYPHIYELVRYCHEIGLLPTLITNALVLSNMDTCKKFKDAGVRDYLISVHGIGETYDTIVGVKGAHKKQMAGIENLQNIGSPIRFNCVLSKPVLPEITKIADLAVGVNARVVNFIAFNPFEDQQKAGKRSDENVPKYSEVSPALTKALDILEDAGIEYNVRYFPFCMAESRHRKAIYNFQQLPYDIHEWDYASWSWTGMTPQRMKDGDVSPVISLEEATVKPISYPRPLNTIACTIKNMLEPYPRLKDFAIKTNRKISAAIHGKPAKQGNETGADWLYRKNARVRATEHCKYLYADACSRCDIQEICDGFHGDYAAIFSADEARPVIDGLKITDPKHYIAEQEKVVECEDYDWAL